MMFRRVSAIVVAVGIYLPSAVPAEDAEKPKAAIAAAEQAEQKYERKLAEAQRQYLEARIAARTAYLATITEAKRAALEAGDLEQVGRLVERLEKMESELEAERKKSLRIQHQLAEPAKIAPRGDGFVLKTLRNGATAYSNRPYQWQNVPPPLQGWTYTQIDGGDTPDLRVEVLQDGVVHVLAESAKLEDHGWTSRPDLAFRWYPDRPLMTVFSKMAQAGQILEVPHFGWTGTLVLVPPSETQQTALKTTN